MNCKRYNRYYKAEIDKADDIILHLELYASVIVDSTISLSIFRLQYILSPLSQAQVGDILPQDRCYSSIWPSCVLIPSKMMYIILVRDIWSQKPKNILLPDLVDLVS